MFKFLKLSTLLVVLVLASCKSNVPQDNEWVGDYEMSFQVLEDGQSLGGMKDSIANAISEATSELNKAKAEMNLEFDQKEIDTTTTEGKIEYAAQQFGKKIAEVSLDLGSFGTQLGGMLGGLVSDNVNLAMSMLENVKIPITLEADGDIKVKARTIFNINRNNYKWEKIGDQIKITDNNNDVKLLDIIADHGDSKLLTYEKVKIKLFRVKEEGK